GLQGHGGAAVGGGDEEAVDAPVQQAAYVVVLQVGAFVGVADDDAVAEFAGLLLHGAGQFGEVRVEDVADDQTDGSGPVGAQRTGHDVGAVAERAGGGQDPFAGVVADRGVSVVRPGDRGLGQSGRLGDVLDAHH